MQANQIRVGAILAYVSLLLSTVASVFYTPILIKHLGMSEYGIYMLIGSLVGYFVLFDFGFGNAIKRYVAKYRAENNTANIENLIGMFALIYLIIAIFALIVGIFISMAFEDIFSKTFSEDEMNLSKNMLIILIVDVTLAFPLMLFPSIIEGFERFVFIRVVKILRTIIFPLILVPLLLVGYKALMVVIVNVVLNLLVGLINFLYVRYKMKVKIIIKLKMFNFQLLREIFMYSFYIFLAVLVDMLLWKTGQLIIGIKKGSEDVAIYAVAMQLTLYYISFSTVIPSLFLPRVTRMLNSSKNDSSIQELFVKTGRIQALILSFITLLLLIFGREFISLWAGEEYVDAWIIIVIILVPLNIHLVQNIGVQVLQAKNLHKFRAILLLCIALLNLLISLPFVEFFGGVGAAFGISLAILLGDVFIMNYYYYVKFNFKIVPFFKGIFVILPISIICALFAIILNFVLGYSLFMFLLKIIVFTIIFIFLVSKFYLNNEEKSIINVVLKRRIFNL